LCIVVYIFLNIFTNHDFPQMRPSEEELKEMGPEFQALWDKYFKDKPDKPVM